MTIIFHSRWRFFSFLLSWVTWPISQLKNSKHMVTYFQREVYDPNSYGKSWPLGKIYHIKYVNLTLFLKKIAVHTVCLMRSCYYDHTFGTQWSIAISVPVPSVKKKFCFIKNLSEDQFQFQIKLFKIKN